ncbi:hypothetical protein AVEN_230017-1 [Araneus ventricosus]|uniref:Uncharacterized protein n=1 Tax=Araneus ventricosus TaxID=182803 RepID=A0A4Y2CUU4_ARAVE|nr:hypothetical protein AVEN_230017-1 [Araneus ventricosus]
MPNRTPISLVELLQRVSFNFTRILRQSGVTQLSDYIDKTPVGEYHDYPFLTSLVDILIVWIELPYSDDGTHLFWEGFGCGGPVYPSYRNGGSSIDPRSFDRAKIVRLALM